MSEMNPVTNAIEYLSTQVLEDVLGESDLDSAMYMVQSEIGQEDGGVCALYWSEFNPGYPNSENKPDAIAPTTPYVEGELWANFDEEERFEHLYNYLKLEDLYQDYDVKDLPALNDYKPYYNKMMEKVISK